MASAVLACLVPIVFVTAPARGQGLPGGLLQDLFQESTWMVAEVDTGKLGIPQDPKITERLPESVRLDLLPVLDSNFQTWQAQADRTPVQLFASMPVSGFIPAIHAVRRQSEDEVNQKRDLAYFKQQLKSWQFDSESDVRMDGNRIVVGPPVFDPLAGASAEEAAGQFADTLELIGDMPIRIAVIPPGYVRETLASTTQSLPKMLGGLPTPVLLNGIQRVAIGVDPNSFTLKIHFKSADQAAARALAESMPTMLRSMYIANPWSVERLPKDIVFASIEQLPIRVVEDRVELNASGETVNDVHLQLLGAMVSMFAGKQRTLSAQNQLKRIGLAVHNHHSAFRFLPPWQSGPQKPNRAVIKEKTNTKLSWRVYLLPFLGESDLYEQFHLDEAWDSPHNKTLLAKMPDIYLGAGRDIPEGYTTMVAPVFDDAILNFKEPTSFLNIVDGLSNTAMVVEVTAASAVPWTAPQDYEFDVADPLSKMAFDNSGRCNVLFGDGSVRKIRKDLDPEQGKAIFGRNDGIPVTLD